MTRSFVVRHLKSAALLAALVVPSAHATAQSVAGDYMGGGSTITFSRATGYRFTVSTDVNVTALGAFDFGGNGFVSRKNVGIFRRSDFSSVVSTTLDAGMSATYVAGTVHGSRFNSVSATLLAGVEYYALVDNNMDDQLVFGTGAVTYDSRLTWLGFVDGQTNDINSTPTFFGGVPGNLGPNFIFSTTAVPEPGALAMLIPGLVAIGAVARRRQTR